MDATPTLAAEPGEPTAAETLAYVGDMLSQLAGLAGKAGDRRLEAGIRLLAVYAASGCLEPPAGD